MSRSGPSAVTRSLVSVLFGVICLSVGLLTWFGSTAIREWQRSSALLADRRVKGATDLLVTALRRDMEGAQHTVLLSVDLDQFASDPSYDIMNLVASAFARYPYPESFFAWHRDQTVALPVFFNRRDRPPQWFP